MTKRRRHPAPIAETSKAPLPALPPHVSVGRRWKFRRDLVIYVAHRSGLSQRLLADVFDLPRSTVQSILHKFDKYTARRAVASSDGDPDVLH